MKLFPLPGAWSSLRFYSSLQGARNVRSWNREAQRRHRFHLSISFTFLPFGCEASFSWREKGLCQLIFLGNKWPFRVWRKQDSMDNFTWFRSIRSIFFFKEHLLHYSSLHTHTEKITCIRICLHLSIQLYIYHLSIFSLKKWRMGLSLEIANRIYTNPTSFKLWLKITTKNTQRGNLVNTDIQFRKSSEGKLKHQIPLKTHSHQATLYSKNELLTFRGFVCEIRMNPFNLSSPNKPVILS